MDPFTIAGIAINVVPQLARWIFGDGAGDTTQQVANVARTVLGTDQPDEAQRILTADPVKQIEFRIRLAEIAAERERTAEAARMDELKAHLADVANARAQTVDLARAGSPIAWGAPLVSLVVLVTFGVVLYRVLAAPTGQTDPNAAMMLGALTTMASAVVGYWVGSSAGSKQKSDAMSMIMGKK